MTHGCYQGLTRVDGRTREGKFLARYQAQLLSDLGVGDDPSIQQATIARTAAFKALRIFMAEQHMLTYNGDLPERLNKDYLAWSHSLRNDLALLGIKREPKPVKSIQSYLARGHSEE